MPNDNQQGSPNDAEKLGYDLSTVTPVASSDTSDQTKSYWRRFTDLMDTSALAPIEQQVNIAQQHNRDLVDYEVNHGNPYRAALAQFYSGTLEDINKLIFGVTTPKTVGLAIASGGESTAAKALAYGANLYFGWRGSQAILDGKQQNETDADVLQRKLFGAAQLSQSIGGISASTKDYIHEKVQNNLGLKGNLAQKVADKVAAANGIEQTAAEQVATRQAATKGQIESTKQIAGGIEEANTAEIPIRMGKILSDAGQVVEQEEAKFEDSYTEMAKKATTPVTNAADMKAEIVNTLKAEGIQDQEIPSSIFKAIPSNTTTVRALTASEEKASVMTAKLKDQGLGMDDLRSNLTNLGFVPSQVDAIMAVSAPHASNDISFTATTRIANDLWDAAQSSKDPVVKKGLLAARDNVIGMRQRYADANNFGDQLRSVNKQYSQFKNELGSGDMYEYLYAKGIGNQMMGSRIAQLISPTRGEALRTLFKMAGIDTKPLNDLIAEQESVPEGAAQTIKDITKQSAADIKTTQSNAQDAITNIGKQNAIIKGQSDLTLAGKSTAQIRQDAINKLATNSRNGGITNPYALIQLMYGTAQLMTGTMFGALHIGRGLAPETIQNMLKSKGFQDWVIDESGVEQSKIPVVRNMIASSYPALRKLAQTGVVSSTIDTANQPSDRQKLRQGKTISISGAQ